LFDEPAQECDYCLCPRVVGVCVGVLWVAGNLLILLVAGQQHGLFVIALADRGDLLRKLALRSERGWRNRSGSHRRRAA